MKLKYDKSINNGNITVVLNATNFSVRELMAISSVGEPSVKFKKKYVLSSTDVDFDIPIRSFKDVKVVFKGKAETIFDIAQEVYMFLCELRDAMAELMGETVGEFERLNSLKKDFDSIEQDILPAEKYPSDEDKPEEPGNNDNDNPEPEPGKKDCGCDEGCDCGGIEIFEEVPDNKDEIKDGLFGVVLPDDEEE